MTGIQLYPKHAKNIDHGGPYLGTYPSHKISAGPEKETPPSGS